MIDTTKTKSLTDITNTLIDIYRHYYDYRPSLEISDELDSRIAYLLDVIATLHNLLYEAETGERYDYMFHWANKGGGWCYGNIFDLDFEYDKEDK